MLSKQQQIFGLAFWLLMTFIPASIGSLASIEAATFYNQLVQPNWAPPAWVFGPVWTTLFLLMALAAWLVWRKGGFWPVQVALGLFVVQLAFNALWSWLFFGWHLGGLAFFQVLFLSLLILATLTLFWRITPLAALLLVPYLLWVSFAAVLNYAVWQLNPQLL